MAGKIRTPRDTSLPPRTGRTFGMLGEFRNPLALVEAAREVRQEGYRFFDAHSPFPIHGMDRAMGLGQSILGYFVFGAGLAGVGAATLMQWWMGAVDYPLLISGKPFSSVPAWIPVVFELTVLLAGVGAVVFMLLLNGLPRLYHPLFKSERFARVTDDRFFLVIEARDPKFSRDQTKAFLQSLDPEHIELVED